MASSSTGALLMLCACRGVRGDSPGLKELMQLRVGGEVTPEDVYNFEVRPSMTRDMSFQVAVAELNRTKGEAFAAAWLTKLRDRANSIQQQRGGLYTGHHDCVRSVFCNLDAGSPEHAQMCFGCMLLLSNRTFKQRVRARTEAGPEPAQTAKYSTLTDDQKNKRLRERYGDAMVNAKREQRHDKSADRMLAAAHARFEVAQLEALSMLRSFMTSEAQRELEKSSLEGQLEAAVSAQQEAEQALEQATTSMGESLIEIALKAALAQAQLTATYENQTAFTQRAHQREMASVERAHQREMASAEIAHQREIKRVTASAEKAHLQQMASAEIAHQRETASAQVAHQREMASAEIAHQKDMAMHERDMGILKKAHEMELASREAAFADSFGKLPLVIQNLIVANKTGALEKNATTVALLEGISTCLKNGSTRGRRLNDTEKAFYGLLLNSGSPWAHKFVANNLFGPHLRTTQKARAAFDHKLAELALTRESFVGLKAHLATYKLVEVPGIISEDATTSLRRLDFELLESTTAQSAWEAGIKLWGFNGGTVVVHSIGELRSTFQTRELAGYVYVWTWVPILEHAPWFPLAIIATNNKFDASWVFQQWRLMHVTCAELSLRLAGHVSDGDARLRKSDFRINFGTNSLEDPLGWCQAVHGARLHSLLYLTLPETVEGLWLFGHQDYMHLAWRVRVQMLSPRKVWQIGAGLTTAAAHLTNLRNVTGDVLLNGKDLDPHNKQHWPGVLKMFSPAVAAALKARIDGPSQETHLKGTYAVIVVFQRYLESWLKDRNGDRNPVDAVKDAAFVLAFLLHWRYYVSDRFDLKINFLTRETCLDLITSCHGCILRFVQFRECWGGQFRPDGSRFSSRFSEYMFQYGRMAQTNSPVVSVKGWFIHMQHYLYNQHLEADNPGLRLPQSLRGIPHSIDRVQIPTFGPSWHPTDAALTAAIDCGVQDAIQLLAYIGIDTNLSVQNGFFKQPWKHFPLKDRSYSVAMAEEGDKEDDPTEARPDGEAVDQTVIAAQDAQDADAVLGQLMRTALPEDQQELSPDRAAVLEEVSALLAAFNQTLQEESKDRKYRFHVKRLLKGHLRAGDAVDPDLDYITDDDDLAVLFTRADGSTFWSIGNIEAVAVARGNVDRARAVGARSGVYLASLDADERPIKGVHIDDPKAMFLFRWYQEIDKSGKVLEGYQNKECTAFFLPHDNGGYPFEWVSNLQVICPVHLSPHPDKNRTFKLSAADRKTVTEAMKEKKRA